MSELPSQNPEAKTKVGSAELLRTMYETGADQLYEEETGEKAVAGGVRTPEAQAYVDAKLASINFEDRSKWQNNAELELTLSQASSRRLQSLLSETGNASGHMNASGHDNASGHQNASGHLRADGSM